jgi:hypothetical protein
MISLYRMPFRSDSTRNEVDIAEKELINVLLSTYFSNCCKQYCCRTLTSRMSGNRIGETGIGHTMHTNAIDRGTTYQE